MDAGNLLDKVSDHLSVRRAFGAAYEKDGTLIIPVALVAGGGGAGTSRTGRRNPATGRRRTTRHRRIPNPGTPAEGSADWCCRPVSTS
jgi:uncharacterized spore protein YtfJ